MLECLESFQINIASGSLHEIGDGRKGEGLFQNTAPALALAAASFRCACTHIFMPSVEQTDHIFIVSFTQTITRVLSSIAYVVFIQGPHAPFLSSTIFFFLSYLGDMCMLNVAIP